MATEVPVEVLERQAWMEPVEEGLQRAVARAWEAGGGAGRKVKNFLHGVWLGHPLHPVLTDVPVGAWTAALVLDALDAAGRGRACGRAADTAIAVGLAGAAGAALTGVTDWQATDGPARRIGLAHGLMNTLGAALYAGSLVMRRRGNRDAGRALAGMGYAVACGAAYLGGHLVYRKRIGVDHAAGLPLPEEFTAVMDEAELREGEPHRAEAGGARILLLRRQGEVYAIAETCSHLGGPLAEGKIEGETVRCPWHGSCFSLATGEVVDGPATHPQPCLETRIREGRIEVRLKGK